MSQSFDKRATNFLPPPYPNPIIRSKWAKCIIYNPEPTLLSLKKALVLTQLRTPTTSSTTTSSSSVLTPPLRPPQTRPNPAYMWPRLALSSGENVCWGASFQATAGGGVGVWRGWRREGLVGGIHPFRSGLFSGSGWLEGKELNKPKGLGHFSCDTPHRLSRGLGGGYGGRSDGSLRASSCWYMQQCPWSTVF